jgi:hypothetical protein
VVIDTGGQFAHDLQRLGQKAAGRPGVPAVGQHEIDQTSLLVDGREQVFPLAIPLT